MRNGSNEAGAHAAPLSTLVALDARPSNRLYSELTARCRHACGARVDPTSSCRDVLAYTSDPHEVIRSCWSTEQRVVWPTGSLYMRKRVLMCAVLAWAMTATNASGQVITNMVKRVGIGGSVGGIFPFDDDVSIGVVFGVTAGRAPAPGFGPRLGLGWYRGDLTASGVSGDGEVGVFASVRSWPASVTPG